MKYHVESSVPTRTWSIDSTCIHRTIVDVTKNGYSMTSRFENSTNDGSHSVYEMFFLRAFVVIRYIFIFFEGAINCARKKYNNNIYS